MSTRTTINGAAAPSVSKAQGKRPAAVQSSVVVAEDAGSHAEATPTRAGAQTRQKRILPSRSRRGGPGVGSCDVDVMILETRKRRLENEPLIPATTRFLLTTKSSLGAIHKHGGTGNVVELNEFAYGRYFDRPEVQKAYKEQQVIQTPEFSQIPDDAIVGGRFRPRSEEEFADTSDSAYEKRHRKYETFEKRQRLREKEKLKHEHYKLKERIEQLRGMDYSAFLALPSTALADPSSEVDAAGSSIVEADGADLPGAHINGAAAYNEGERRRKEMLDVALGLEERYKVLLPPDRKWLEKKEKEKAAKRESLSAAALEVDEEEDEEEVVDVEPPPQPVKKEIKSPVKKEDVQVVHPLPPPAAPSAPVAPSYKRDSDGESEVDLEERDRQRSRRLKLRIKFTGRPTATPTNSSKPSPSPMKKTASPVLMLNPPASPSILESISPAQVKNISAKAGIHIRSRDGKFLPKSKRYITEPELPSPEHTESISAPLHAPRQRGRKRRRTEPADARSSPIFKTKHSPRIKYEEGLLVVSAKRTSLLPHARKTQRNMTAFGAGLPPELSEVRDFEIPKWLHNPHTSPSVNNDVLEHGSAYGYSVSLNGAGSVSAGGRGESEPDEEDSEEDELMGWEGDNASLEESQDDILPIASLDEDT